MTEKKSSRYANIACALFVLLAVITIGYFVLSGIDIKNEYLQLGGEFGAPYLIYWIVNILGTLLPAVIYFMVAYVLKKQKDTSLILLLTIVSAQHLSFSVSYFYSVDELVIYELAGLFEFIAFVLFTAMLFAFVKGKGQLINQFRVFSAVFYMLSFIFYIIYMIAYGALGETIQNIFNGEEELSTVIFLLVFVLRSIVIFALPLTVGAYLKNRESVNNVFYDIEEEKQNSINPVEMIGSAEKIKEYKDMLDSGIITQDEFDKIKLKILNTANRGMK